MSSRIRPVSKSSSKKIDRSKSTVRTVSAINKKTLEKPSKSVKSIKLDSTVKLDKSGTRKLSGKLEKTTKFPKSNESERATSISRTSLKSSKPDAGSLYKNRTGSTVVANQSRSRSRISQEKNREVSLEKKKSSTKKVALQYDPCACGPDFYTNVLGPTADETILLGLQTFMKFCQECPTDEMLVDSGTGLSTKGSSKSVDGESSAPESNDNVLLQERPSKDTTQEEELRVTEASEGDLYAEDVAEIDPSARSVSIKEIPENNSSIDRSLDKEASKKMSTIRESPTKELSTRSLSKKESVRASIRSPSIKSTLTRNDSKSPSIRNTSEREPSINDKSLRGSTIKEEEVDDVNEGSEDEPETENELQEEEGENEEEEGENEEEAEELQEEESFEDFAVSLHEEKTSSRIAGSQTTQPSRHCSNLQAANDSSSQESQTDDLETKDDVSQTGSMVEVGKSQTSQHTISNAVSQTHPPSLKSSGSQAKHFRSAMSQKDQPPLKSSETQVLKDHCSDKAEQTSRSLREKSSSGKKQQGRVSSSSSSKLKDSSESCTCCPCVHSADTTSSENTSPGAKSTSCSCSSCRMKQAQKPAVKRSCLKATKCICSVTRTNSKNSVPPPAQKRRVTVCCDCNQSSSLTPSTVESEKSVPSQMGDTNETCIKVRYAITKITKFYSYTTFEVMRSTRKKPKVMPKSLEGVFVLKNAKAACPVASS